MNPVTTFTNKITEIYKSGHATEHSYRPALQELFKEVTELTVYNEPKRSEFGAPDFVFTKGKIVIAYAEAKDIYVSLDEIEKGEQMTRYYGYSNIILTNGLDFRFYRNAIKYGESIVIGKLDKDNIEVFENSFQSLSDTIKGFIKDSKEPIKSGAVLSKVMAGKARRIRDNVRKFLEDEKNQKNENLLGVYEVIKKLLLADLDHSKFADMYAQTIVYGLFVARYYDKTTDSFSRQEARDLVPASNPFLRHFFDHIAGSSFDPRIEYIVNELCEEFNHADVQAIVHNYYKIDKDSSRDPIIHFYEDFLQEYDSLERKKMGVFYTPLPVVRFIVRAVDDILKKEFNLPQGLADSSKIDVVQEVQGKKHKVSIHKVQVLDPATGTGTFLNEAILHIRKSFEGQEGRWSSYVNNDLLPRLHGFELMMASYTIAHLKLSSTILETGAKIENTRLGVYLTNSLEKSEIEQQNLFNIGLGKAITEESNQANKVKNELPIMVVIGNPPYSGESSNAHYKDNDVYKTEPSGGKLQERNSKWLNDDYVKFIRLAESMIEKTDEGIVAMITAHGYIDNPTFRGMRHHLMQTFEKIYVLDLHGNTNKKEKALHGGKDENVFNIKTGVSIFIGIKHKSKSSKNCKIFRVDSYGTRNHKFEYLNEGSFDTLEWIEIKPSAPNFEWVARDTKTREEYQKGISVADLFPISSVGIVTSRDAFVIDFNKQMLKDRVTNFLRTEDPKEALKKFDLKENLKWKVSKALGHQFDETKLVSISYRPFDDRFIYYSEDFIERSRKEIMRRLRDNSLSLEACRQVVGDTWDHVFVTKSIVDDSYVSNRSRERGYIFPVYLYADDGSRVVNLNKDIVTNFENIVGKITPEDIFDYLYAVLHSPIYRKKYVEFLKIDFPRVPYPTDKMSFDVFVALGKELRELHLLESPKLKNSITTFPEVGSDMVDVKYPKYKKGKVYINEKQYFGNVPEIAWNFYIGGYQPAQKWLKDRQGRVLSNSDLEHYQRIVSSLMITNGLMNEIDKVYI